MAMAQLQVLVWSTLGSVQYFLFPVFFNIEDRNKNMNVKIKPSWY